MSELPPLPQPYPHLRVGHFRTEPLPEKIGTAIDLTGRDIDQELAAGLDAVVLGADEAATWIPPQMLEVLIACEAAAVPTVLRAAATADLHTPVAAVVSHIAAETQEVFHEAKRLAGPERAFRIQPAVDPLAVLTEPAEDSSQLSAEEIQRRRELVTRQSTQAQADQFLAFLGLPVAPEPLVTAVIISRHAKNLDYSLENLKRQNYNRIDPLLVIDPIYEATARELTADWDIPLRIVVANPRSTPADKLNLGVQHAHGEMVAVIEETALYGSHYLSDQVQALQHSGAHLVGKASWFVWDAEQGKAMVHAPSKQLRFDQLPAMGTMAFHRETGRALGFIRKGPAAARSFTERIRSAGGTVFVSHANDTVMLKGGQTLEDIDDAALVLGAWPISK